MRAINCTASLVAMKAGRTDAQHPALHTDRPETAMSKDERVLQLDAFAKYAVAFSRMSRSILTRASSARRRLISICSGVTDLMSAPVSLPWRCALTQLNKVWSDIPRERAAAASVRPVSTSRTASSLNSRVYLTRSVLGLVMSYPCGY
ncbi:hypothetical protein ALP48_02920 [Pseudomonas syringae pv. solidagae]|uniref:Uncharacterized protein n=1 Tax=Pseudomonas syringae pv. solidagae TaxID=264458 RepID=A0A3M5LSW2_PSESX|nr:hypothetical protein ALP49_03687 [Pseudomonas syringae pv. solidagae]RMT51118.1 hypothetical protein ALP48_02920 [Pseudomonas syringae pv. solidagae]